MFITVAIALIICGVLLLLAAKRMPGSKKLRIPMAIGGAVSGVSGAILVYSLLAGNIVLPLH